MAKGKKKMTVHKKTLNTQRPNGKAWKQHPKGWDPISRSLATTLNAFKGKIID